MNSNVRRGDLVERLLREGVIAPLDAALARLVRQLDADADPALALAVALASRAVADGHGCLPLANWADGVPAGFSGIDELPDRARVEAALAASALVGHDAAGPRRELYLDRGNLYLGRYFHYECTVATVLRRLAAAAAPALDADRARAILARHFPARDDAALNWQAVAVATGLLSRLTVITGGPGTGKTTTVQWLLASLVELALDAGAAPPRIALAAPTGKAATRLAEALRAGRARLAVDDAVRELLPETTSTVHRLLGARPDSSRFRHHAGNPLDADIVVVDEVSMLDLPLMAKLLDALPHDARLVLLGDRDQLASVEAGNVLAGICAAAGDAGVSAARAQRITALTGATPPTREAAPALADCVVALRTSHRFGAGSELGQLAAAIRDGDAARALEQLAGGRAARLAPADGDVGAALVARHLDAFAELAAARDPAAALAHAARFRILTALRDGGRGCVALNHAIERAIRRRGGHAASAAFYPGRLLMVTENAYGVDLFNGDTGIVLADADGRLVAWFPASDGVRSLPLSALPAHESAFAITIHKSQGSEFDAVSVVLPREESPILGRELLYTAVTRARGAVTIVADEAALRRAIERTTRRHGALAARLLATAGVA